MNKHPYVSEVPHLIKQWVFPENYSIGLDPEKLTLGSNKKAIWHCEKCGNNYSQVIASKALANRGCSICSNRKIIKGYNDLNTINPLLAKEWSPNNKILPNEISPFSHKKVLWVCPKCGREYSAEVKSRNYGSGCGYCNRHLSTSFPEQAIYYYLRQKIECYNRFKIGRKEVDIFVPSHNIGIEFNGTYYHKDIEKDRLKVEYFSKKGIRIISIYDKSQNKINLDDDVLSINFNYRISETTQTQFQNIINYITSILDIDNIKTDLIQDYQEIISNYQSSLDDNITVSNPNEMLDWDYSLNKVNPEYFTKGSNWSVYWKCHICGKRWKQQISVRCLDGCGCSKCNGGVEKAVAMYMNNKKVAQFCSIRYASEITHMPYSAISRCINGTQAKTGNYLWKLAE